MQLFNIVVFFIYINFVALYLNNKNIQVFQYFEKLKSRYLDLYQYSFFPMQALFVLFLQVV